MYLVSYRPSQDVQSAYTLFASTPLYPSCLTHDRSMGTLLLQDVRHHIGKDVVLYQNSKPAFYLFTTIKNNDKQFSVSKAKNQGT